MRNKFHFLIVLLIAAIVVSGCASAAFAQSDRAPQGQSTGDSVRTISVTGSGKVTLSPDIAYLNIGVHTEGKEATESVASNTNQTQKLVEALKKAGIDAKDIQTINFSIYPQQQYSTDGKPQGLTYVVDNTVYVTIRNLNEIGELLDAAVSAGANTINGIQFDVADKTKALSEARKAAIVDAKSQAEELAQAAGVKLGLIHSISTSYSNVSPIPMYEGRGGAVAVEAAIPVSPGQMTVSVEVTMVFEIP